MSKSLWDDVSKFDRELHKKLKLSRVDRIRCEPKNKRAKHHKDQETFETSSTVYRDRATERRRGNNPPETYEDALFSLKGATNQVITLKGPPGVPMSNGLPKNGPPGVPMLALEKCIEPQIDKDSEERAALRVRLQAGDLLTLEERAVMGGHLRDTIGISELGAKIKSLVLTQNSFLVVPNYASRDRPVLCGTQYRREQKYVSCRFSGPKGLQDRLIRALNRVQEPKGENPNSVPSVEQTRPTHAPASSSKATRTIKIYDDSDDEGAPSSTSLPLLGEGLFPPKDGCVEGGSDTMVMDKATILKSVKAVVGAVGKKKMRGDKEVISLSAHTYPVDDDQVMEGSDDSD